MIVRIGQLILSLFLLLGPSLSGLAQKQSDTVLVPGNPQLTQNMIDHAVAIYEFVLDIELDAKQRSRFQQATIEYWEKEDRKQIEALMETLKLYGKQDELRKIRDSNRQGVIDALRADTGSPDSVVIVEAYDAAHPEPRRGAGLNGVAGLVGTWKRVDFLNASKNPYTGRLEGVSYTDSRILEVSPDGSFKYTWVHNHCDYKSGTCCHQQASFRNGSIAVEGANLVFDMAAGNDLYKDDCNHSQDKNSPTTAAKVMYPWTFSRDPSQNDALFLCWDEPGQKQICLRKQ
jgi:hypothetical protein